MLSFIRWFLKTTFIAAIRRENQCFVIARTIKNGKVIKSVEGVFECSADGIEDKFNDYLQKREKESYFTYFGTLFTSSHQWALPVASKAGFERFGVDLKTMVALPIKKSWTILVLKNELNDSAKFWQNNEPDLIYSPFALLHKQILKHSVAGHTLYIYNTQNSISVMIFDDKKMYFAAYFDTHHQGGHLDSGDSFDNLDSINISDIESLLEEDDSDLTKLDALDNINSFGGGLDEIKGDEFADVDTSGELDNALDTEPHDMGRCAVLITNIRIALSEYYKNTNYQSDFISHIRIFDDMTLDNATLSMIEAEFLVSSDIISINALNDLSALMLQERLR